MRYSLKPAKFNNESEQTKKTLFFKKSKENESFCIYKKLDRCEKLFFFFYLLNNIL